MISIIITTYNIKNYVKDCIQSVLNQTYKDLEIIIVDDGSTDGTCDILKEFNNLYDNIKIFYLQNGGVSIARNKGIAEANGDFIMFIDGDDKVDETIVEKLFYEIDDQIDMVICCCKAFDDKISSDNYFLTANKEMIDVKEKEILFLQLMDGISGQPENQQIFTAIGVPWGKLYRTKWLKENNLVFNQKLRRMQDNIFNMYCFANAKGIIYLNEPLYNYRVDNISKYLSSTKRISAENYYNVLKERDNFFSTYPNYKTKLLIKEKDNEVKRFLMHSIKSICLTNDFVSSKQKLKDLVNLPLYKNALANNTINCDKKFDLVRRSIDFRVEWVLWLAFKVFK